jgi:heterodisulfide reductase subunit B
LDLGQNEIEEFFSEKFSIPVIHLEQFLRLAQGSSVKDAGLLSNFRKFKPEV